MKTSARNQFYGRVSAVRRGAVNDEIELALSGGDRICATITHESTQHLGLDVGTEAFALVKSSWVILAAADSNLRTSARNNFIGTVTAITRGAVNSEVVLALAGGAELVAIITNTSLDNLALQLGQTAEALFKASHVIIGVAG